MKYIFFIFLSVSTVFGQKTSDSFKWQDGNTYKSSVEYTFDDIPDNGSYSCIMSNIKGDIDIIGHPGSGTHLIIEPTVYFPHFHGLLSAAATIFFELPIRFRFENKILVVTNSKNIF